jgi:hypothetical protein
VKSTPRRRRQQVRQPQQEAAASFAAGGQDVELLTAKAYVIRHGGTRHGLSRKRKKIGKLEWAQAAIAALLSRGAIPPHISDTALTQLVNEEAERDPRYRATRYKLSRQTVVRAWQELHAANR